MRSGQLRAGVIRAVPFGFMLIQHLAQLSLD